MAGIWQTTGKGRNGVPRHALRGLCKGSDPLTPARKPPGRQEAQTDPV